MSYFEGQASSATQNLLSFLEEKLAMLGDEDQGFIRGCRLTLGEGGVLTAENHAKLKSIYASLDGGESGIEMGSIATDSAPLSTLKILKDLAGAIHTLNPEERKFANLMATKYKALQPMDTVETQKLMTLYTLKGF